MASFDIDTNAIEDLFCFQRSELRDSVRVAFVNYVVKEISQSISTVTIPLALRVALAVLGDRTSSKLRTCCAALGTVLVCRCNHEDLPTVVPSILQAARRTLQQFITPLGRADDDEALALKDACYSTIAAIAQRAPTLVCQDFVLVSALFKLVEIEDERIRVRVTSALGEMRKAIESLSFTADSSEKSTLVQIVLASSRSPEYRARLACLSWIAALKGTSSAESVRLLVSLSSDPHPSITQAVRQSVDELLQDPALEVEGDSASEQLNSAKRLKLSQGGARVPRNPLDFDSVSTVLLPVEMNLFASNSAGLLTALQLLSKAFRNYASKHIGNDIWRVELIRAWNPPILRQGLLDDSAGHHFVQGTISCSMLSS
jgi:hypothetical protein